MELGLFRNKKIHKKKCNRHITLMIIPDPTKQGMVVKIPKWLRFPALACLLAIVLGSLYLVDYIAALDYQLTENRYTIQTNEFMVEDKDVTIETLEATNLEHYEQLEQLEHLQASLEMQLADIQAYKEELDTIVNSTEKTTSEQPEVMEEILPTTTFEEEDDNVAMGVGTPFYYEVSSRPTYQAATNYQSNVSDDSFDATYINLLSRCNYVTKGLINEEAQYSQLEEGLDVMIPFWEAYPCGLPVEGSYVTSAYGYRIHPIYRSYEFHYGVDLKARYATVNATGKGIVIRADYQSGYGYTVEIDHGYGYVTKYAHLSKFNVSVGDEVVRGQEIATSGNSGMSSGPHLHYEVRLDGVKIDPEPFLTQEEDLSNGSKEK